MRMDLRLISYRRFAALCGICALVLFALAPATALARTTRPYQGSIGSSSFETRTPTSVAVDQDNGDVYAGAADGAEGWQVHRFTAAGAPHDFTAGPNSGTNTLTGTAPSAPRPQVAIDNSGGPLDGTIYFTHGAVVLGGGHVVVSIYAQSGALLGQLAGSGVGGGFFKVCGIAVDQANGDLYVSGSINEVSERRVWRYSPSAPGGSLDDLDYTLDGSIRTPSPCSLAADSGKVYVVENAGQIGDPGPLIRYSSTDFAPGSPEPVGTPIGSAPVTSISVDHTTGEVYADEGDGIAVYEPDGNFSYRFGARGSFGIESTGVAVRSAPSGPASKAYVADNSTAHQVDVFGTPTQVPHYTHPEVAAFGLDGSASTQFNFNNPQNLAFANAAKRLYALDVGSPAPAGIYGFDASSPPIFSPLSGFAPFAASIGPQAGLAVDNTALASQGNIYLASDSTGLLYGFNAAGTPLAGFPVDPETTPGAPNGSPKGLCGAAVDSTGNVWVANNASEQVLEYSSAGAYLGAVDTSGQGGGPCSIAVDSGGDLYADILGSGLWKYTAASSYANATFLAGGWPDSGRQTHSLAVDPANDHLYVADYAGSQTWVDELDPAGNLLDEFATDLPGSPRFRGIALDPATKDLYLANAGTGKIHVFGPGVLLPEPTAKPASAIANHAATLEGTVISQGVAVANCHFEYVTSVAFANTGFTDLSSGGSVPCAQAPGSIPLDLAEHAVSAGVSGLGANTAYRYRLVATNDNGTAQSDPSTLTTTSGPEVETTGAPIRTTDSAQLTARVYPVRAETSYHFEYGTQGPCASSPCASTPARSAGSGDQFKLVAEEVEGLQPNTTYHYRIVADNGNSDGAAAGADATVTTRASEDPLTHGPYPGPPGSDRAYEMVSLPDAGGNPVSVVPALSADGNRALYGIAGGTPIASTGGLLSLYFAQRDPGAHPTRGWQTKLITPPRSEVIGPSWVDVNANPDLSSVIARNGEDAFGNVGGQVIWRLHAAGAPEKLFTVSEPQVFEVNQMNVAAGASTAVATLKGGSLDPAYPAATTTPNLYALSGGAAHLVSLMPGGTVPTCGVPNSDAGLAPIQATHPVSEDGSLVFFASKGDSCSGSLQLYLRDLGAEETKLVSGPPLSGPSCGAGLIKAIPGFAFFWTATRLSPKDTVPASCSSSADGDVYRYQISSGALTCVTCVAVGVDADVVGGASSQTPVDISIPDDGSRVYFSSAAHLLAGTPPAGQKAVYRVMVGSGALAYVGSIPDRIGFATGPISADGTKLLFLSSSTALNQLGGSDNGGTAQAYLYDDEDRSLTCVSCPTDGSAPAGKVKEGEVQLAAQGSEVAFSTPTSLLPADQNTPAPEADPIEGTDIYEWRDGRTIMVTDGQTQWLPETEPIPVSFSSSGRDLFFIASAAYTPDALDSFRRLYDARIGGGIDFPPAGLPPCDLNSGACEGPASPAPEQPGAGSAAFSGPGNSPAKTKKAKKHKKKHKAKRHGRHHKQAGHKGRAGR
jgi:hypothetical protein